MSLSGAALLAARNFGMERGFAKRQTAIATRRRREFRQIVRSFGGRATQHLTSYPPRRSHQRSAPPQFSSLARQRRRLAHTTKVVRGGGQPHEIILVGDFVSRLAEQ